MDSLWGWGNRAVEGRGLVGHGPLSDILFQGKKHTVESEPFTLGDWDMHSWPSSHSISPGGSPWEGTGRRKQSMAPESHGTQWGSNLGYPRNLHIKQKMCKSVNTGLCRDWFVLSSVYLKFKLVAWQSGARCSSSWLDFLRNSLYKGDVMLALK